MHYYSAGDQRNLLISIMCNSYTHIHRYILIYNRYYTIYALKTRDSTLSSIFYLHDVLIKSIIIMIGNTTLLYSKETASAKTIHLMKKCLVTYMSFVLPKLFLVITKMTQQMFPL